MTGKDSGKQVSKFILTLAGFIQPFRAAFAKKHWFCNINLIEVDADFSSAGTESRAE